MKKIFTAATLILAVFIYSGASARGLSFGILGTYAVDGGAIEKTATSALTGGEPGAKIEYDPVQVAGAVLFARYDFRNNIFLRTGVEINKMVKGGEYNYYYYDTGASTETLKKFELDYEAYTIPFLLGITLSPDKGRTSVYGAAGAYVSEVSVGRSSYYKFSSMGSPLNEYNTDAESDSLIYGFCGIFGVERKIYGGFNLVIEYALYTVENTDDEKGEIHWTYQSGALVNFNDEYHYRERFGVPRQQLRAGFKYDF